MWLPVSLSDIALRMKMWWPLCIYSRQSIGTCDKWNAISSKRDASLSFRLCLAHSVQHHSMRTMHWYQSSASWAFHSQKIEFFKNTCNWLRTAVQILLKEANDDDKPWECSALSLDQTQIRIRLHRNVTTGITKIKKRTGVFFAREKFPVPAQLQASSTTNFIPLDFAFVSILQIAFWAFGKCGAHFNVNWFLRRCQAKHSAVCKCMLVGI